MADSTNIQDVLIVGGGPAGLSAGLSLVRARRSVTVIDAGEPRNRFAGHMHGVLGHDGLPPLELAAKGRDEIEGYGGTIVRDGVRSARIVDGVVEVDTENGTLRGRRLIVATGLRDELPDVPGVHEQWGRGVVVCPYCDGWEHRDDIIGVLGTGPRSTVQAQLLRQWSDRIAYFPHTAGDPTAEEADGFARRGIAVHAGTVAALTIEDDVVSGVEVGGETVPVGVVFTGPTMVPNDGLVRELGATATDGPAGSWIDIDQEGRTSVPAVWAIGNVSHPHANVSVSLGMGATAAASVNLDLVLEDVARA